MTYKQLLAMNAPEVPAWYEKERLAQNGLVTREEIFFDWREYYADQMIERFGDGEE